MPQKKSSTSKQIADLAVLGMEEKRALDICVIDLREVKHAMSDYFVICHGTSNTHVDAIADSVEDLIREQIGEKPSHKEGFDNAEWILIDYFHVIVHVFQEQFREHFQLEELWSDGKITRIENKEINIRID